MKEVVILTTSDSPMTSDTLNNVIVQLEATDLRVMAAVSDRGSTNETMWRRACIPDERTWFPNPADPCRYISECCVKLK